MLVIEELSKWMGRGLELKFTCNITSGLGFVNPVKMNNHFICFSLLKRSPKDGMIANSVMIPRIKQA